MFLKNNKNRVGSEVQYGPRPIGELIDEYFEESNEPLAVAWRKRNAELKKVKPLNTDGYGKD